MSNPNARKGLKIVGGVLLTTSLTHSPALAAIDGTDDGTEGYATLSTQVHAPAWGNGNFLGNVKAVQDSANLNVILSGKVDNNALLFFIDSKPGGINSIANNTITSGGEEFTINNLDGFTFETGFDADFAVRIFGNGSGAFINTYDLNTGVRAFAGNALGANISSGFIADASAIWTDAPVDPTTAVNGVELSLDISALGVPTGTQDVKLFALVINGDSNFASNQMQGSQDGAGVVGGSIVGYSLETEPGTQTNTVSVTAANPDNDGDGLLNSVETNNGFDSFVSPSDTGTDPDDADTDDDLLEDGDEVNVHGTNPTKPDTDNDGANDATEVKLGTDATSGPIPSGGETTLIGFDHFDYNDGGIDGLTGFETRVFDFDNSTDDDVFLGHTGAVAPWSTSFGTEILCTKLITSNGSSASRDFNGADTGGTANGRVENISGIDAKAVYAKVVIRRNSDTTFGGLSFLKDGVEVAFAGVRDALNTGDRNFGVEIAGEAGAAFTGPIPVDRTEYCIVAKLDSVNETIEIWVDPNLGAAEPAADAQATFVDGSNAAASGIRLASGGGGRTFWDDLVVATDWASLATTPATDNEPDGLRDSWEEVYSPGDDTLLESGSSADADLLNDEEEQALGTDPLKEDTDDDFLDDDVETNDGIFVSDTETGTDPCSADTDGDTLSDVDEIDVHSTDPNDADSDDDLENDGFEVFQGTDPNDGGQNSTGLGLVQVNGTLDGLYGSALEVQTVNTEFGDNASELNAGYAVIQDGKLYILLTGNLENNFNKLNIFIDSVAGGQTIFDSSGNDNSDVMDDMFFPSGFTADYHLIARRGSGKFDLDFADLGAQTFDFYEDILTFGDSGYGPTGTGVNTMPIRVAYDGSNTAGVVAGTGAADQAAAAAVTTGLELCIDLADLGNPTGPIRVMAAVSNSDHTFWSNQILGGLPGGTANLGNPVLVDFDTFAGDQFFTLPSPGADFTITKIQIIGGGTQLELTLEGLTIGDDYLFESTETLAGGSFTPVGGSTFTAAAETEVRTIVITPGTVPKLFVRAAEAP
ncbi:MAG: hypothetical protein AAGI48_16825 [Verrucomicrobiota bacterium]